MAFRREESPSECATVELKGLQADKKYLFENVDDKVSFEMTGEEAMNNFTIRILKKRDCCLIKYRNV